MVYETLSPRWEETFVFKDLTFYGPLDGIVDNPPIVIVEFFDQDLMVSHLVIRW